VEIPPLPQFFPRKTVRSELSRTPKTAVANARMLPDRCDGQTFGRRFGIDNKNFSGSRSWRKSSQ